ncbi:septum formation initiator family protein [Promicromonospora sp. NPDC060271]|uniref:FtsB family cell division protein n=1 Tax=Promicromonospora sp. NPDC060271 TaxID=3347089 RepID=UPI0036566288
MPSSRRPARPSGPARGSGARPSAPRAGAGASGAKKAKDAKPTGKAAPKKQPGPTAKGSTARGGASGGSARQPAAPPGAGRRTAAPRSAPARSAARPGTAAPRAARPASGAGVKRPTQPRRRSTVNGSVPPPRADRKRGSFGLVLPEVLTVRAMVLSVVVLLAVVLLLPTVRAVVTQQAELRELRAELNQQLVQKEELDTELARWDDPSYVIEQARSRLHFVMPGDKVWRPLDTDSVQQEEPPPGVVEPSPGASEDARTPWFTSVWDSVRIAGGEE